jgi:dienelactone hydrolase
VSEQGIRQLEHLRPHGDRAHAFKNSFLHIKVYPDAGHGFLNDHDPGELPFWVTLLAKATAASHDEESAQDARRRIIAFLATHLER